MAVFSAVLVGFINAASKYLTAETFSFRVNATGLSMKRRQIWSLEFLKEDSPFVQLRSSLNKYLQTDNNGKISGDQDSAGPAGLFILIQHPDGRVSFQSEQSKRYLGGAEDNLSCFAQTITDSEKWTIQLATHPNVNMFCPGKRRYLRLDEKGGLVTCDKDLPWGPGCAMTLYFDIKEKKYGIRTGNNNLIATDGKLELEASPRTLYFMEMNNGMISLKDLEGKYLTGREAAVKAFRTDRLGRDECFMIEHSPAQVSIRSLGSERYVLCTPGADIYANQTDIKDTEIFQLIINDTTKKACFRAISYNYLSVCSRDTIVASPNQEDNIWFDLQYHGEKVFFKTLNGRYVTVKPNGQLTVGSTSPGKNKEFILKLVNRPLLILQSEFGFVGIAPGTPRLDGNRAGFDANKVTSNDNGFYQFKVASVDKYWAMDSEGVITATGDQPINYIIEFVSSNSLILKAPNGKYMVVEEGGAFTATGTDAGAATLFRY